MEKNTILIADDAEINRKILARALKDEYEILEAVNGEETLKMIAEHYKNLLVVLLDINMPRINGFQVMNVLNKKNVMKYLPIILITGDNSNENMRKGYEYGAVEFISKPFDIQIVRKCILNVARSYGEKNRLEQVTIQQNRELREQAERFRELNSRIMEMMSTLVEFRGLEGNNHIKRVKAFTNLLAQSVAENFPEYNLGKSEIAYMTAACCLHDIGKIMIPDYILLKPGKLTPQEYEITKSHTTKGSEIIDALKEYQEKTYYKYSYEICRYHHERYDGLGYPENLKGDAIPISAQIVSITEAFDALMTNSIYKERIEFDEAFRMITDGECGMFSPNILYCFTLNKEKLWEIDRQYTE